MVLLVLDLAASHWLFWLIIDVKLDLDLGYPRIEVINASESSILNLFSESLQIKLSLLLSSMDILEVFELILKLFIFLLSFLLHKLLKLPALLFAHFMPPLELLLCRDNLWLPRPLDHMVFSVYV